jgi:hypothetical protein
VNPIKNADDAAFPSVSELHMCAGLTKREYFAALALQGLLAGDPEFRYEVAAQQAVKHADALLKALEVIVVGG